MRCSIGMFLSLAMLSHPVRANDAPQLQALVYRGEAACEGCPEAVAQLLETSAYHFNVTFCGPDEAVDISPEILAHAAVYAYPGGPDLDDAWDDIKEHADTIRNYVQAGGRYMGFCLGAYLAGKSPGLQLLPKGIDVDSECERDGAQVKNEDDDVIQVDWHFNAADRDGKIQRGRWLYFQEGAVITGFKDSDPSIIARYSSNGDVAASVTPFGRGYVGLTGPHPEATKNWYKAAKIENPEGIRYDIGYDFVEATMVGIRKGSY